MVQRLTICYKYTRWGKNCTLLIRIQ